MDIDVFRPSDPSGRADIDDIPEGFGALAGFLLRVEEAVHLEQEAVESEHFEALAGLLLAVEEAVHFERGAVQPFPSPSFYGPHPTIRIDIASTRSHSHNKIHARNGT